MKGKALPDLSMFVIVLVYVYIILHPRPKAKIRDVKAGGKGNVSLDAKGFVEYTRDNMVLDPHGNMVLGLVILVLSSKTFTRLHQV